jgi:hypothetical protein
LIDIIDLIKAMKLADYINLVTSEDIERCRNNQIKQLYYQIGFDCALGLIKIAYTKLDKGKGKAYRGIVIYVPNKFTPDHELAVYCGKSAMQMLCELYAGLYIRVYKAQSVLISCRNRQIVNIYQRDFPVQKERVFVNLANQFHVGSDHIKRIVSHGLNNA